MKQLIQRLILLCATGSVLLVIYVVINRRPPTDHTILTMPDWVPFWPEWTTIYLGMMFLPGLMTMAIKDRDLFIRCIRAYVIAFSLAALVWILHPTILPRPDLPSEWWNLPYHWLAAADRPVNILPCAHNLIPTISMWFIARERRSWLWFMAPLLAAGTISIAVTWQHRPVDIVIGFAIAAFAIAISRWPSRSLKPIQPVDSE